MFELRETGDWDIFLSPPERARAETGGADQWVIKRRECSGFARVNKVTSASLGYPLSVFNKNSTFEGEELKHIKPLLQQSLCLCVKKQRPSCAGMDRKARCFERR